MENNFSKVWAESGSNTECPQAAEQEILLWLVYCFFFSDKIHAPG